ncbi:restriction endonuclease subunit S [Desulfovibrio sp. SGI.169]|uniref:restriction endonuclease subunit S n=1 Tax=Desulfovibrio sp. SGI.169 TaxID=3420561 RepID=UPI003CFF392F
MARPRRNAAKTQGSPLTPDEVAEIPVEEQPYPLPEGWKWVRLGDYNCYVSEIVNPEFFRENTFELYSVPSSSLGYPEIILGKEIGSSKQSVEPDDVLLCKINPRINRVWKVTGYTNNKLIASSEWIIFRNKNVSSKYIMYCMKSKYFREYMLSNVSGVGGSLMRAQPKYVQRYPIPLPPIDEQQRIVDRIESLFAKLDDAKAKAEAVLDGFEIRKAALLHKAFTGELIGKKNIKWIFLESILDDIRIGPFGSILHEKDYIINGIPVINPKHIVKQHIFPQVNVSINCQKAEELSSYKLSKNDIILGRRGEMGRCAPVSDKEAGWLCGTGSMILRLKEKYRADFYSLFISSPYSIQYFESNAVGTTLKNLNEKIVRKLPIPQISIDEQTRLIHILDNFLAKEQQVKEDAENVLNQIELMKKAILARAFRGELGTHDSARNSLRNNGSM